MEVFLLINILSTNSVQKWYCEKGTGGPVGRILVADTDRDSRIELIFGYAESLHIKSVIYELYPDNYFHLEAIIDTMTSMTWATGDFDLDGFYDVVLSGSFGIPFMGPQIYESPDSFSYPIREVWRDTVGQTAVVPTQAYDVDKDGIPEIFDKNGSGQPHWIWVYESYGNNQYDTVITSLGANDTMFLWTVPNVISDSCKIMIWTYGPPRPGEQQPRGIAWDFSDSVFTITDEGIETNKRYQIDYSLKILQNPVSSNNLKIRYSIPRPSKVKLVMYNALGQLEQVLIDREMAPGIYELNLRQNLPNGIHFLQLSADKKTITEKVVIIR